MEKSIKVKTIINPKDAVILLDDKEIHLPCIVVLRSSTGKIEIILDCTHIEVSTAKRIERSLEIAASVATRENSAIDIDMEF